jgi:hypothetical protein
MNEISGAKAVVSSEKELLGLFGATVSGAPAPIKEMSVCLARGAQSLEKAGKTACESALGKSIKAAAKLKT